MYAYVDESGNTGYQIFDLEQPLFITAGMMTKTNFDAIRKNDLSAIARRVGVSALHANQLGISRIEDVADSLLKIIKQADARFFICRLEKKYLAAAKVYDTYFDAGENLAVPWHVYWARPLRLTLTYKIAQYILTEEIVRAVWECLTATKEEQSKIYFISAAKAMLSRASNLPDFRSRQIVTEALQWAIANPENFSTHLGEKIKRNMHAPNFVAFTNLMDGIHKASVSWGRPVREIVHDRQTQFEKTLMQWHEMYSRPELANEEPVHWPGEEEPLTLARLTGSVFRVSSEEASPGLQVIDVVLWLFKRVLTERDIGPRGARLLMRVFQRGYQSDFSFEGVGAAVEHKLEQIYSIDVPEEQARRGVQLLAEIESNRLAAMRDFLANKAN